MAGLTLLLPSTTPISPPTVAEKTIVAQDFCACDFRCDFEEKVFASDANDLYENDLTDFLFRKITPGDTLTIKLYRHGKQVATITDSTYGTFYDGFTSQPLYIGWVADWTLIYNAFQGGLYQIKAETVILGVSKTFSSRLFRLYPFNEKIAHKTVKIESTQNGNIESSEFDFTNLIEGGWKSYIRLPGIFGELSPTLERDIYQDSSYREIQNRDSVVRNYTFRGRLFPESLYDRITTKDFLGNTIRITSYNLFDTKEYIRYPVVPESFDDVVYDSLGRTTVSVTFSDRQKNINKRNF